MDSSTSVVCNLMGPDPRTVSVVSARGPARGCARGSVRGPARGSALLKQQPTRRLQGVRHSVQRRPHSSHSEDSGIVLTSCYRVW